MCAAVAAFDPTPARTARALVAADAAYLVSDEPRTLSEAGLNEAYRELQAAGRDWQVAGWGPRRWTADRRLLEAETGWFAAVVERLRSAPVCVAREAAAHRGIIERGVPLLPPAVRGHAWRSVVIEPPRPATAPPPPNLPRLLSRVPPDAHAALAISELPSSLGWDVLGEFEAALVAPRPDPWLRLRYAVLLGSGSEAAVEVARGVSRDASDPCVGLAAQWEIATNWTAGTVGRLAALEEVERIARELESNIPGDPTAARAMASVGVLRSHLLAPGSDAANPRRGSGRRAR